MKKTFLTMLFTVAIFLLLSQNETLWSKRRFLDEPRVHRVQKGESLSQLAKQHYGSTKRWHELALVNRAPKPGHLEVGEEILLPSAAVINELRRTRTLTRVNTLIGEQQAAQTAQLSERPSPQPAANLPAAENSTVAPESEPLVPETTPETIIPPHEAPASFPWFWLAIGSMLIGGVAGFIWYRRQQAEKAANETKMVEPRRNVEERSRERQAFSKPPAPKENLAI